MKEIVEVERSTDGAIRLFSADEIASGALYRWVTKQDKSASGLVNQVQDLSGNTRALKSMGDNKPYVVRNGGLVLENGRPSLRFNSDGEYYEHPISKSRERTIGLRANPDTRPDEHAIADIDGVGISEKNGSIRADLYESNTSLSVPHSGDSARIFVACSESELVLQVDDTLASAPHAGDRTRTGTIYVGNAPNKISYAGTVQQVYVWNEFKGEGGGRDDILGLLSAGSFLGVQMQFRFSAGSNSATIAAM